LDGLPTDLSVKAGICLLNMGRLDEAKQAFDELLEEGVDGYPDLFIKVADAYTCAPYHPSSLLAAHCPFSSSADALCRVVRLTT
jgi:pentatricopeptide repeat protein